MSDRPPHSAPRALRLLGGGVAALLLGLGAIVLLMIFLNSRDGAGVTPSGAAATVAGTAFDDPRSYLDGEQVRLLDAGNVYVVFGTARPAAALVALRDELSGPPDPVLERAGQAVVLVRRAGTDGVVALAAGHRLLADDPADPRLHAFATHWLGRGGG